MLVELLVVAGLQPARFKWVNLNSRNLKVAANPFPALPSEWQIVPDENKSEGGQKKKNDEEDLLAFDTCSQIDQEDPYP